MSSQERHGRLVAQVCEQLAELRSIAEAHGELPELERIVGTLRVDTGNALAALDELLKRCGIPSGADRTAGGLPRIGAGHPVEEAYVCPDRFCARVVLPHHVAEPPACTLNDGRRLSLIRV